MGGMEARRWMPGRATWDVAWANKAEAGGKGETAVLTKWGDRTGFKRTVNVHLRDDDDLVEGVRKTGGSSVGQCSPRGRSLDYCYPVVPRESGMPGSVPGCPASDPGREPG